MGNHQLAIEDFQSAIDIDDKFSEGYYRMGKSKFALKQYDDAIEDFKMSREKERELENADYNNEFECNPGIQDGLGQCYHSLQNWNKALEYYDLAIEQAPLNSEFYMHRSTCYYDQ